MQLYADGFAALPLKEKTLIWHLYEAALAGRDIYYDQRYEHGLEMRDVLEAILTHSQGVDPKTLEEIHRYTKLFWINSGPFNNLTARKFVLRCTPEAFAAAAHAAQSAGATFPLRPGETLDQSLARLKPAFFDPDVDPTVTAKTPPAGKGPSDGQRQQPLCGSHDEGPRGVPRATSPELEAGEERRQDCRGGVSRRRSVRQAARGDRPAPGSGDSVCERIDGQGIDAHSSPSTGAARPRIARRTTSPGLQDKASPVDTINGFVEVYLDARGTKGAFESLVFYVNRDKTSGIRKLAESAQWFEDRMPWDAKYRKQGVQGITANAIDVVIETGDSGPVTPVGINLPNDQAIRERFGSKSVSLSNVTEAYDKSTVPALRSEFSWTPEETARATKWSALGRRIDDGYA